MTDEEKFFFNESKEMLRKHTWKVMQKNPKSITQHAKDIGISYQAFCRFLKTDDPWKTETFSKLWAWLEKNNTIPSEEECDKWHQTFMKIVGN
jgi:hypothetical protein